VPEPTVTPVPEPTPEPRRSRARAVGSPGRSRSIGARGLRKPYIFVGGDYSKALRQYKLPGGLPLASERVRHLGRGAAAPAGVLPVDRFHREVWEVPKVQEVLVRRFELIYGLDVLALPPDWRVRPALMALLGFGFGFGRIDSLVGAPDPLSPQPAPRSRSARVWGSAGCSAGSSRCTSA
jgi:hypothetical protein